MQRHQNFSDADIFNSYADTLLAKLINQQLATNKLINATFSLKKPKNLRKAFIAPQINLVVDQIAEPKVLKNSLIYLTGEEG